jgi:hypothetical protein
VRLAARGVGDSLESHEIPGHAPIYLQVIAVSYELLIFFFPT